MNIFPSSTFGFALLSHASRCGPPLPRSRPSSRLRRASGPGPRRCVDPVAGALLCAAPARPPCLPTPRPSAYRSVPLSLPPAPPLSLPLSGNRLPRSCSGNVTRGGGRGGPAQLGIHASTLRGGGGEAGGPGRGSRFSWNLPRVRRRHRLRSVPAAPSSHASTPLRRCRLLTRAASCSKELGIHASHGWRWSTTATLFLPRVRGDGGIHAAGTSASCLGVEYHTSNTGGGGRWRNLHTVDLPHPIYRTTHRSNKEPATRPDAS